MNDNKQRRKNALKICGMIGLFLLVFGLSFALFRVTLNGTKKSRITTGNLSLQLLDENYRPIYEEADETEEGEIQTGYGINLENTVPMTYAEGMETEEFTFIVRNNGTIPAHYDLKLEDEETTTLDRQYIRYILTEADYNKKANNALYNGGYTSNQIYVDSNKTIGAPLLSSIENDILDYTTIFPGEEIHYTLKMWVDYDATTAQAGNKTYEGNIVINGTNAVKYYEAPTGANAKYTLYNDGTLAVTGTGDMGNGIIFDGETEIEYGGGPLADFILGSVGMDPTGLTANAELVNCEIETNVNSEYKAGCLINVFSVSNENEGSVLLNNCRIKSTSSTVTDTVHVVGVRNGVNSEAEIINCNIYTDVLQGDSDMLYSISVYNAGNATIKNSYLFSDAAISLPNEASPLKGGIGVYVFNTQAVTTIANSYVFGNYSGMLATENSKTYVTGGTFESPGYGGICVDCGTTGEAYVEGAKIASCDYKGIHEGFTAKNKAGLYIFNDATAYLNNCEITNAKGPAFELTSSNTLYISNSTISKDYKASINNDTNKLYIGRGCNFTADDTNLPEVVTITNEVYTK